MTTRNERKRHERTANARKTFRDNLLYYTELRKLKQADISKSLGISQTTVNSWYTGTRYPRIDVMQRLADYLMINITDLNGERITDSEQNIREVNLLNGFRKLSVDDQEHLIQIMNTFVGR